MSGRCAASIRGRLVWNALRMLRAIFTCYRRLRTFRAHVALVTGGYASVPVVLAARLAGIPVVLHLPDTTPGWAARWIALLAAHVTLAFDLGGRLCTRAPTTITGYPLRPEFEQPSADRWYTQFDLNPNEPLVLVMGGSQGARRLNRAVGSKLEALLARTQSRPSLRPAGRGRGTGAITRSAPTATAAPLRGQSASPHRHRG